MIRKLIPILGFAALAGLTTASAAQSNAPGGPLGRMLLSFDSNGDGAISRDEARQGVAQRFAAMDANGDGTITRDERRGSRRADRFRSMDLNGDGAVSLEEMRTASQRRVNERFAEFDRDGNGLVTLDEVQQSRGRPGPMTLQDLDARIMRMFDRADRNRDGLITPDEAKAMRRHGRRK